MGVVLTNLVGAGDSAQIAGALRVFGNEEGHRRRRLQLAVGPRDGGAQKSDCNGEKERTFFSLGYASLPVSASSTGGNLQRGSHLPGNFPVASEIRHRGRRAEAEQVLVIFSADDLGHRPLPALIALVGLPGPVECVGIVHRDIHFQHVAAFDKMPALDDMKLFGVWRAEKVDRRSCCSGRWYRRPTYRLRSGRPIRHTTTASHPRNGVRSDR